MKTTLMKKLQSALLSAVLISVAFSLAGCTAEYDPVKDFEKAISDRKSKAESGTHFFQGLDNRWHKGRYKALDVRYDVKKTDSLVNPFAGVVTFTYLMESGEAANTVTDAQATTVNPDNVYGITATLTYAGTGKSWHLVNGSYFSNEEPEFKYPFTPESINTRTGYPYGPLKDWL
jgi:hypothetical protein